MAVSPWSKGFSRQSDNDGLVRVKIVDEYLATESEAVKAKVFQRFMSEPAYRAVKKWGDGSVSGEIVKEKAYRNLCARNWVIPGMGFSFDAIEYKVVPGVPKTDFNSPPEAQRKAANVWTQQGIFTETHPAVLEGKTTAAMCCDWNPATGTPEWFLERVKERVAQVKANMGGSSGFGK